ncbi:MAG: hypothetical protein ACI8RD_012823, partial [Bacillariaceae sp.]
LLSIDFMYNLLRGIGFAFATMMIEQHQHQQQQDEEITICLVSFISFSFLCSNNDDNDQGFVFFSTGSCLSSLPCLNLSCLVS